MNLMIDRALKETLLAQAGPKLEDMLRNQIAGDVETERLSQLRQIVKHERYWKGDHYHYPTIGAGRTIEWSSVTGNLISNRDPEQRGVYDYVLNYFYGDGLKLVGILGRMPNAKAVPNKVNDTNADRAAKADSIIRELWAHWDVETQQAELILSLFKNGTTFGYTPYVADPERYGLTEAQRVEMRRVQLSQPEYECAMCGQATPAPIAQTAGMCQCGYAFQPEDYREAEFGEIPEVVDTNRFANGSVEFHLCTPYTVTTPFYLKSLKRAPWLWYEYEEHAGILLRAYPRLRRRRREFESGGQQTSSSFEAEQARQDAAFPTPIGRGARRSNYWRYSRVWATPAMFEVMEGDENGQIRDALYGAANNGLKITAVNGNVVDIEDEALTETWMECKPTVGEYLYPQPLGTPYVRPNDLINDGFNIMAKTAEKGIPITFFDPEVINLNAIRKHRATPVEMIPVVPQLGKAIRDAVWESTPAQINPVTTQVMDVALNAPREISGITRPLWGGEQIERQTLGEAEMKRNQALQPHNTTWGYVRRFWAGCYRNAVLQFAKYSSGTLYFGQGDGLPPKQMELEDIQDLQLGGWHVECDEAIPMTWGQRRAQLWQILDKGPELWQLVGLAHPRNLETLHRSLGNDDFEIPGKRNHEKAMAIIKQLLEGSPIITAEIPGMPPVMLPSIPADELEDDHGLMVQSVRDWAQDDGLNERKRNPLGYANVIAWARQHLQFMNAGQGVPGGANGGARGATAPKPGKPDVLNPRPEGIPEVAEAEAPPSPEELAPRLAGPQPPGAPVQAGPVQ